MPTYYEVDAILHTDARPGSDLLERLDEIAGQRHTTHFCRKIAGMRRTCIIFLCRDERRANKIRGDLLISNLSLLAVTSEGPATYTSTPYLYALGAAVRAKDYIEDSEQLGVPIPGIVAGSLGTIAEHRDAHSYIVDFGGRLIMTYDFELADPDNPLCSVPDCGHQAHYHVSGMGRQRFCCCDHLQLMRQELGQNAIATDLDLSQSMRRV